MQLTMLKGKIHRATVVEARLDYVGSGMICLNGAAARMVQVNDKVIIMCYAQMTPEEAKEHKPKVVFVDEKNDITRVTSYEKHGLLSEME